GIAQLPAYTRGAEQASCRDADTLRIRVSKDDVIGGVAAHDIVLWLSAAAQTLIFGVASNRDYGESVTVKLIGKLEANGSAQSILTRKKPRCQGLVNDDGPRSGPAILFHKSAAAQQRNPQC